MPVQTSEIRNRAALRTMTRNVAGVALVALHAMLLWQRCTDATILEPVVLAKYAGALLLLASAFAYRRIVPEQLRGRQALLLFWIVTLLLHTVSPMGGELHDVQGEIVAIVELGLALPLAFAAFVATADAAQSLQQLHRVAAQHAFVASASRHLDIPSRAPPRSC
jgi:hypothetical protein